MKNRLLLNTKVRTGEEGMGLKTIHHVVVRLNWIDGRSSGSIPDQYVTALRSAHDVAFAPEARILDLHAISTAFVNNIVRLIKTKQQ